MLAAELTAYPDKTCWSVELCLGNVVLQYWAGMYNSNIMLQFRVNGRKTEHFL